MKGLTTIGFVFLVLAVYFIFKKLLVLNFLTLLFKEPLILF